MHNRSSKKLETLTRELTSEKILEFLDFYAIMKMETRAYSELEGINGLKEFFEGALESKKEGGE